MGKTEKHIIMDLTSALLGKEYEIRDISLNDRELEGFLFSLGCYKGEGITVISRRKKDCIVSIKDGRYSIDGALAQAIKI